MAHRSVEPHVEAAKDYLRAAGFTDVKEAGADESDVRVLRMTAVGGTRVLKLGVHWLQATTPVEVSALLSRKDVAALLREGEGVEIRDPALLHHFGLDYPA